MEHHDRPEFAAIVVGFAELRGKKLSAEALELFWSAMQRWDIGRFREAAAHLVKSCQFMPTPYDFEQLRKAGRQTAGEAWARAVDWAASSAYRGGAITGDAVTDRCARMLGGYGAIAMCDEDKLHFLEKRFTEHFEAVQDAEHVRESLPAIAGPSRYTALPGPQSVAALLNGDQPWNR